MGQSELRNNTTAILLAAGYGSRIANLTDEPKCLLKIGGATILERHLDTWQQLGIRKIVVVVGYKAETIKEALQKYTDTFEIEYAYNSDYRNLGNTYSLALGLEKAMGPTLIFDADLVYDAQILENFLSDQENNQILVGKGELDDIECAKVLVDMQGYVRKTVDKRAVSAEELELYKFSGEALGILKFSDTLSKKLKKNADSFLAKKENQNKNWEHLLNEFLLENNVSSHHNPSEKWIEIDTDEDFKQAVEIFA